MAQTQKESVLDELAKKQEDITKSLPWDQVGSAEQVERLRVYLKEVVDDLRKSHLESVKKLEERLVDLENHKHNPTGDVIVEKPLSKKYDKGFNPSPMVFGGGSSPSSTGGNMAALKPPGWI